MRPNREVERMHANRRFVPLHHAENETPGLHYLAPSLAFRFSHVCLLVGDAGLRLVFRIRLQHEVADAVLCPRIDDGPQ